MSDLKAEIKLLIVDTLELEDVSAESIGDDDALFDDGLGLDSIDALELGVALQKAYGVKIDEDDDALSEHFQSVTTLARFVEDNRA